MKKILIPIFVGFAFFVSICAYASCIQSDISKNVIRLHIIANSDSEADQSIKLIVRDEISKYLAPLLKNSKSISESESIILSNLTKINEMATKVLQKNGVNYVATASLTEKTFPTRSYSNVTLPAGKYKALCINLGSGKGKNWWCVMFPPLCLNSSTLSMPKESENYLKSSLHSDSYNTITSNDTDSLNFVFRFKIFDYITSVKEALL